MRDKLEMLKEYISANVVPILLEGVEKDIFDNATILPANISKTLLVGAYEGVNYICPTWYELLKQKQNAGINLLLIDDITAISKEEQLKFYEILKYRKIDTFKLPDNCVIIILASKVNKDLINKDIYSLVAHI